MREVSDRKSKEKELHDHLRGKMAYDLDYQSNLQFYSISQSNRDYVRALLVNRYKGKLVLDYCCGNGGFALSLAEAGVRTVGIDISPVSISNADAEAARRGLEAVARFHVMDAEATEFSDSHFDAAVVNGVLHHLDLPTAYRELARIVKPEGIVVCTEALKHNPLIHLYRKRTPHLRSDWEIEHILGKSDIEMARQYFGHVEIAKFFHLATIAAVPFRRLPVFGVMRKTLEVFDAALLRLPLVKWQAWMAVFVLAKPCK